MRYLMVSFLMALNGVSYAVDTATPTATGTNTLTATVTPTATRTATVTATPTRTASITPTITQTATPTFTPSITATFTVSPTTTPVMGSVKTPEFQYLWAHVSTGPSTQLVSLTLTPTESWITIPLNCGDSPCSLYLYNTSSKTLFWWVDNYTADPAFDGFKLSQDGAPLIVDIWPGAKLHYKYSEANGSGFMQNRW